MMIKGYMDRMREYKEKGNNMKQAEQKPEHVIIKSQKIFLGQSNSFTSPCYISED